MLTKERILELLEEQDNPIMDKDILVVLGEEDDQIGTLIHLLDELVKDGYIMATKKRKYALSSYFGFERGNIQVTQKGFGFLLRKDEEDVFIPASEMNTAMNGDTVFVKITKQSANTKKCEGVVTEVLVRANPQIVGRFEQGKSFGFVIPDDRRFRSDVFISKVNTLGAKTDDKVVVEITKWPDGNRNPEGKVKQILGTKGEPGVDILSVIYSFGLPLEFPKKVLKKADMFPDEVSTLQFDNRKDLREELIITIDGKDAKDLDDAIHVKKLENGNYVLGVHIADVSEYVREGSPIDKEAFKRATSVYLLNRVIPMLPEKLSNGLCSLNPHVPRLTMSCIMEIDPNGAVVKQELCESVIQTTERMNYEDVSDIIEGNADQALLGKYEAIIPMLTVANELRDVLNRKRDRRGAIDFNFAESKIILDGEGRPIEIGTRDRRVGHRLIEEFMLAANEAVAEYMFWLEHPFVYRIHETPDPDKINQFNKFLYNFGHRIKGNEEEVHPKAIQQLLRDVKGKDEEHIVAKLMLRSLKQAKYDPENEGHFGLAAKYYCHFTSPIRRYPDLMIHRIIKMMLRGELDDETIHRYRRVVAEASLQSSERERIAESAERDVDDMKMCEYMADKIGDEFEGMISSVTSFGIFVELPNTVEGLIRVKDMMDDYYVYDQDKMMYIGERTKKIYKIGGKVNVELINVNVDQREIDFRFIVQ